MGSSPEVAPGKFVVDAIHGDIHLTDREWNILDTPTFQRLRSLKQLGMGHVTYPNATHTRFSHSLGTLGIMARILDVAKSNKLHLTRRQQENLRMAALLHDIGHYPYSHLMEQLDSVTLTEKELQSKSRAGGVKKSFDGSRVKYPSHVELGAEIVTRHDDLIRSIGGRKRAREIADLFARTKAADPQLSKLIHSSFDMDRLDYLQRDSRAAGVPYGNIDVDYLLNSLKISPGGMVGVSQKALPAAEQFMLARFFMYRAVYYHKTTYALEEACRQLLRRIRDEGQHDVPIDGQAVLYLARSPEIATFTDAFVDGIVHRASNEGRGVVKALAGSIQNRRPPRLLKEVSVFEETARKHHAGTAFWQKAKSSLADLADRHGIPNGQFLLCKTKPLRLEERGAFHTTEQARQLPPEAEDELIKVFIGGETEPRSLVDIDHSLIQACAGRYFQTFRIYVIYEGSDRDSVIARLRDEVGAWDTP